MPIDGGDVYSERLSGLTSASFGVHTIFQPLRHDEVGDLAAFVGDATPGMPKDAAVAEATALHEASARNFRLDTRGNAASHVPVDDRFFS